MPKRVFIIHGWDGYPEEGWFPWLKKELESRGFEVQVPAMPNAGEPKIDVWVPCLAKLVGEPDEQTYFVGHSIGCQTILRYLATIDKKIGGAVFVAGWFLLNNLEDEEVEKIAEPWLTTSIDFERIKSVAGSLAIILSDNDPYDCLEENSKIFKERLDADVLVESGSGHFRGSDGVTELPSVFDAILKMSS